MAAALERRAYKLREVAAMLGKDRRTIYRWLERGVLREVRVPGAARMVDAASLDGLIRGVAPPGRKALGD